MVLVSVLEARANEKRLQCWDRHAAMSGVSGSGEMRNVGCFVLCHKERSVNLNCCSSSCCLEVGTRQLNRSNSIMEADRNLQYGVLSLWMEGGEAFYD